MNIIIIVVVKLPLFEGGVGVIVGNTARVIARGSRERNITHYTSLHSPDDGTVEETENTLGVGNTVVDVADMKIADDAIWKLKNKYTQQLMNHSQGHALS